MSNLRAYWIHLFILLILTVTYTNERIVNGQSKNQNNLFIEERILEITFIGISRENVSQEYLLSALNKTIKSVYPFGNVLSDLIITPTVKFIDNFERDEFSKEVFEKSKHVNNSDFYIEYDDFVSIVETNLLAEKKDHKTIMVLVISFCYSGSIFGSNNVYINYTQNDLDTKRKSALITYSEKGVSFGLEDKPVLGLITSSKPAFLVDDYPLVQEVMNKSILSYSWTQSLGRVIEQALWSRLNPSPLCRYSAHHRVNVHLGLVGMDHTHDIYDILSYLNTSVIENKLTDILMISEVSMTTVVTYATNELKLICNKSYGTYFDWFIRVSNFLQQDEHTYWDESYSVRQGEYYTELDLYTLVMVGEKTSLPWSDEYAGFSFYATNSSEYGRLSLITMNYDNLFGRFEGLTRSTLHEIGHLLGLSHPHDYWDSTNEVLEFSWVWGYTRSPMTYLVSGYEWDYFDRLNVWIIQIKSLLNSMAEYDYEGERIGEIYTEIHEGTFNSYEEVLQKTVSIYTDYQNRKQFHTFFQGLVIPGLIILIIFGGGLLYFYHRGIR